MRAHANLRTNAMTTVSRIQKAQVARALQAVMDKCHASPMRATYAEAESGKDISDCA